MASETTTHETTIYSDPQRPPGVGHRAECSCSWAGTWRLYQVDATADARRHADLERLPAIHFSGVGEVTAADAVIVVDGSLWIRHPDGGRILIGHDAAPGRRPSGRAHCLGKVEPPLVTLWGSRPLVGPPMTRPPQRMT